MIIRKLFFFFFLPWITSLKKKKNRSEMAGESIGKQKKEKLEIYAFTHKFIWMYIALVSVLTPSLTRKWPRFPRKSPPLPLYISGLLLRKSHSFLLYPSLLTHTHTHTHTFLNDWKTWNYFKVELFLIKIEEEKLI